MLGFFFSFTGNSFRGPQSGNCTGSPFEGIFLGGILSNGCLYQPGILEGISSWRVLRLTQGGVPRAPEGWESQGALAW